ncbi:MAG: general secretion pathway protein GspB [Geobacter sp.]|nr:general secretion pathway protein GspB [Geobacter sp.]
MSLILDALRKMEQDRKTRRQTAQDIRPEVLSYRGRPHYESQRTLVPLLAVALLIVAGISTGLFLYRGRSIPATSQDEYVAPPVNAPVTVQPPPPAAPLVTAPPAVVQAPPPPVRTEPAALQPPVPPTLPIPAALPVAAPTEPAGTPAITVSGIAWQDERQRRRAVINGMLVAEGADVAGATVVEIKENRVRFSRGGKFFEIAHSSALSDR